MKTFIVYDLDTGLPIAVGEAIKAEWARVETAEETDIRAENLIAEEISFGKECELQRKPSVQQWLYSLHLRLHRKHLRCCDHCFQSNPRRHLTVKSLS